MLQEIDGIEVWSNVVHEVAEAKRRAKKVAEAKRWARKVAEGQTSCARGCRRPNVVHKV
ncbi:hypothetical protein AXF42_Ash021747 [Apostasia shenzhenica]|uniref:Uncharacterized protein n=1 Tax=Apostasia shenzhenica TaxID=1088818 RepID=A0A2H9ZY34_9ASPA|nr:hypothetical protein AXF42_Ash021747 [Apostasia shenzhenica]